MSDDGEPWFHRIYLFLLFTLAIGSVMDGYDHAHGGGLEAIVTPGHVLAYGSVILITVLFGVLLVKRHMDGQGWWEAVPDGYQLTVISLPLFFLGGGGDMVWHMVFGLEQKAIEVMSPTHMAILGFGAFISSGPLRRAWYRGVGKSWREQFAMLSASAFTFSILTYLMILLYPFTEPYAASWHPQSGAVLSHALGVAGILTSAMILMAVMLLLIERFDLVFGAFTYILGLNALLMTGVSDHRVFVPGAIVVGLCADVLYRVMDPGTHRPLRFRVFALVVPMLWAAAYFIAIMLTGEIVWSVHTWTGSIAFAGVSGLLVSYAIYPSAREPQD